jgi:hypothetical protein
MNGRQGGRGLLLVAIDVDPAHEDDFNRWYDEEHLPERLQCEGFLSARRYVALEGEPKYLALYELEDPGVLDRAAYQRLLPPSEWMQRLTPHFPRLVRNVYSEITPDIPDGYRVHAVRRGR